MTSAARPSNENGSLPLRTVTAVYPGAVEPRRGHFIEGLHLALDPRFKTEVLAPRVFSGDPLREQRRGIAVHRFPYHSGNSLVRDQSLRPRMVVSYLRSALRQARSVWPATDRSRGGLVLGHWVVPTGWIAARVARRLHLPLVLYAHGSDLQRYGEARWMRPIVRGALRQAVRTIVASEELAERAAEMSGKSVSEFDVIPVGIEEEFRTSQRKPSPVPPVTFLFVGDLLAAKGFPEVIAAWEKLRRRNVPVRLRVMGRGPLASQIPTAPGLEYLGPGGPTEVRAAMEESHLLVLPSHREGTPLVIQEALAVGLPVAATPVGGIPALYADRQGWFPIDPNEPVRDLVEIGERLARVGAQGVEERTAWMAGNLVDDLFVSARARRVSKLLQEVAS